MITLDQIKAVIAKINLGGVVLCNRDTGGVIRSERFDAFEIRLMLPKEGLYAVALVPLDATVERVAADVDGSVAGLRHMSAGFKANEYEPEVCGPSLAGWFAERQIWLAKIERRAPTIDFDALAEVRREIVEMVDLAQRVVKVRCHICNRVTEGPYEVQVTHDAAMHEQWRAEREEARAAEEGLLTYGKPHYLAYEIADAMMAERGKK